MKIKEIQVLSDNYAYLVWDENVNQGVLVDPADPVKCMEAASECNVEVTAVLTTHHHADHAGGNLRLRDELMKAAPPVVLGGDDRIPALTRKVAQGDEHTGVGSLKIQVISAPCHTRGHVLYVITDTKSDEPGALFCGDTLFIGGCGRFFEGTGAEMVAAMQKIADLPPSTRVFCGHEYTVANLTFAATVEPDNDKLSAKLDWAKAQRAANKPTIPSTVEEELSYNPFMRTNVSAVVAFAGVPDGAADQAAVMAAIRQKKNDFKDPIQSESSWSQWDCNRPRFSVRFCDFCGALLDLAGPGATTCEVCHRDQILSMSDVAKRKPRKKRIRDTDSDGDSDSGERGGDADAESADVPGALTFVTKKYYVSRFATAEALQRAADVASAHAVQAAAAAAAAGDENSSDASSSTSGAEKSSDKSQSSIDGDDDDDDDDATNNMNTRSVKKPKKTKKTKSSSSATLLVAKAKAAADAAAVAAAAAAAAAAPAKLMPIVSKGAVVDQTCDQCGAKKMYFKTAQIRSVDEGQTVFYECTKCDYKFSVNN